MIWVELHENEASRDTILVFTYANKKIRPQNCCIPKCTKKVYEENGMKISFHKFPEDKVLFRKWIVAIRRDVGKDFKVNDHTRICSWHFKAVDYLPSLTNRKRILKPAEVPSVFIWKKGSPVKRKSPKKKKPIERKTSVEGSKTMTAEVTNVTFSSKLKGRIFRRADISRRPRAHYSTRRNATLEARVFSVNRFLESDKDVNFYTGFPGRFVFEKLYELQYVNFSF